MKIVRKYLAGIAFGVLIAASCAPNAFPADGRIPEDTAVTLQRSVCYGECPAYMLTVKADGTVNFVGRQFTETVGEAEGRIGEEQMRELVQAFESADFFALDDHYTTDDCSTDNPTVLTSLTINGESKEIEHDTGCGAPAQLGVLENRIDEIVGSQRWIGDGH